MSVLNWKTLLNYHFPKAFGTVATSFPLSSSEAERHSIQEILVSVARKCHTLSSQTRTLDIPTMLFASWPKVLLS
jgi:hypothetical protein